MVNTRGGSTVSQKQETARCDLMEPDLAISPCTGVGACQVTKIGKEEVHVMRIDRCCILAGGQGMIEGRR